MNKIKLINKNAQENNMSSKELKSLRVAEKTKALIEKVMDKEGWRNQNDFILHILKFYVKNNQTLSELIKEEENKE